MRNNTTTGTSPGSTSTKTPQTAKKRIKRGTKRASIQTIKENLELDARTMEPRTRRAILIALRNNNPEQLRDIWHRWGKLEFGWVDEILGPLEDSEKEQGGWTHQSVASPPTARDSDTAISSGKKRSALDRIQEMMMIEGDYKPISIERAEVLADIIVAYDDDEQAHAFIELLYGIAGAHFAGRRSDHMFRPDVESLVMAATHRAYSRTAHFGLGLNEFAMLNPTEQEDLRVLRREYGAESD